MVDDGVLVFFKGSVERVVAVRVRKLVVGAVREQLRNDVHVAQTTRDVQRCLDNRETAALLTDIPINGRTTLEQKTARGEIISAS